MIYIVWIIALIFVTMLITMFQALYPADFFR